MKAPEGFSETAPGEIMTSAHTPSTCTRGRYGCKGCDVRLLSVCAALDCEELGELEALAQTMTYTAKSTLFMQGEPADHLYTVTDGVVRLYKLLPDGRRQIIGFALPGDFLGLGIGTSTHHKLSADAVDAVTMCRFARGPFEELLGRKPHFLARLHDLTTHQLTIAQDRMVLLGRQTAEERVVSFLLQLRDRWARILGTTVHVPLPMGRQDIADFLGLTIETVSRTLTALARNGMIVIVPDGVRLLKPQELERLATA